MNKIRLIFFSLIFSLFFFVFTNSVSADHPHCHTCEYPIARCFPPNQPYPIPGFPNDVCREMIPEGQPGACSGASHYCCYDRTNPPDCPAEVTNPLVNTSGTAAEAVSKVVVNLVNLAYIAGVVVFFFMLISGGIQWISSGGDKMAVSNARGRITHAFIGLVVLMGVFAMVYFVETVFEVDLLEIDIGSLGF